MYTQIQVNQRIKNYNCDEMDQLMEMLDTNNVYCLAYCKGNVINIMN